MLEDLAEEDRTDSTLNPTKVVAVDPDGNETTYPSCYKASKETGDHSSVIYCCGRWERYAKSGTSKITGIKYKFHYEGENQ